MAGGHRSHFEFEGCGSKSQGFEVVSGGDFQRSGLQLVLGLRVLGLRV